MSSIQTLATRRGVVPFPAYIPVITFGSRFPLDALIRPYLPRLASAVMIGYPYAQALMVEKSDQDLPVFMDSGGFAALIQGAKLKSSGSTVDLVYPNEAGRR